MNETPHYYSITPANVRYDNRLPANAKLLYGELTALCNKEGYCWAGNAYFANLYGKNERSIINWINALKDAGYITVTFTYVSGTREIERRHIRIAAAEVPEVMKISSGGGENNFRGYGKNFPRVVKIASEGGEKKCADNITNNTKRATTTTTTEPECQKPVGGKELQDCPENSKSVVAAPYILKTEELKAIFSEIDENLVFDPEFYDKIGAYLTDSGLDGRYFQWLYEQCKLKSPKSLTGLYYKLFFAPNLADLFKIQYKPKVPSPVVLIVCPVCAMSHDQNDEKCPECGFEKHKCNDTEAIEQAKWYYALPPDKKEAYNREMEAVYETKVDFRIWLEKSKEIQRKYGLN
ncbi:hypothetical protein FACS189485_15780 [Spirochaetia bacterium]|nr:hypothetical protein FACS189485_15780 [Spirochaetia bacterium]